MSAAVEEAVAAMIAMSGKALRTCPRLTRGAGHQAVHAAAVRKIRALLPKALRARGDRGGELDQILEVDEPQLVLRQRRAALPKQLLQPLGVVSMAVEEGLRVHHQHGPQDLRPPDHAAFSAKNTCINERRESK